MKFNWKTLAFLTVLYSPFATAIVLINAPPPAHQHVVGDSNYIVSFAGSGTGTTSPLPNGAIVDTSLFPGFRIIDMATADIASTLIYLEVYSSTPPAASAGQQTVVTLSTSNVVGGEIPLTGASLADNTNNAPAPCLGGSTCQDGPHGSGGVIKHLSAYYSGNTLRLSFTLADLCGANATYGTGNICSAANTLNQPATSSLVQSITATFAAETIASASPYPTPIISGGESATVTLSITDVPPGINRPGPNIENFYYPANKSIIVDADNYSPNVGVGSVNTGADLQSILILADRATSPTMPTNGSVPAQGAGGIDVVNYINYTGDRQYVSGFENSTSVDDTANGYHAAFYAMNSAGILSTTPVVTPFTAGPAGTLGSDGLIHAEPVNSVLTKSGCFIATAAFHSGDAGPVVMLRKFRDHVLTKFGLGRAFIHEYYHYSPPVAQWAWDKPIIRSIALHALAPVEFVAWAILKFTHAEQVEAPQSYIDRVKKKIDEDDPQKTSNESYIDSVKKTLGPTPADNSYIERVDKTIPAEPKTEGSYSESEKAKLPPAEETESPIKRVKEHRDAKLVQKRDPITTGVSFQFGVNPGVDVNNTEGTVKFSDMYGNGSSWQPDLVIRFEHEIFHSENFGSFGLAGSFGLSYAEGYGRYAFPFGSQSTLISRSKFSFVQAPITVGANYRFNLLRILRPYVGAEFGSVVYDEIHTDGAPDGRGQTPVYEGRGGVTLLLDGLDAGADRDSFETTGIQHSYLYLEYLYLRSFAKSGVLFSRAGIYLGFMFEY